MEKKKLIEKYLEGRHLDKLWMASVMHYVETGRVSGSFMQVLRLMMDEYHEQLKKQMKDGKQG